MISDAQRISGEANADAEGHTFVRTFKWAGLYQKDCANGMFSDKENILYHSEGGVYTRKELTGTEVKFFVFYFEGYIWTEK